MCLNRRSTIIAPYSGAIRQIAPCILPRSCRAAAQKHVKRQATPSNVRIFQDFLRFSIPRDFPAEPAGLF